VYHDADVASEPGLQYEYSVVWESNEDPSDDWQFQGEFDWDFYRGTDRWYRLITEGGSGEWSLVVNDLTGGEPYASGARALVKGPVVLWVIPMWEFESEQPAYRVSAFRHDGTFDPEFGAGDVSGADPTEPPIPITLTDIVIDVEE